MACRTTRTASLMADGHSAAFCQRLCNAGLKRQMNVFKNIIAEYSRINHILTGEQSAQLDCSSRSDILFFNNQYYD